MSTQFYFSALDENEKVLAIPLKALAANARRCEKHKEASADCIFAGCINGCKVVFEKVSLDVGDGTTARIFRDRTAISVDFDISQDDQKCIQVVMPVASFTAYLYKFPHDRVAEPSCLVGFYIEDIDGSGENIDRIAMRMKICLQNRDALQTLLKAIFVELGLPAPTNFGIISIASECRCCK